MTEDETETIRNACRRGPIRCGMDHVAGRCIAAHCPGVGPAELSAAELLDDWLRATLNLITHTGETGKCVRRDDLLQLIHAARQVPMPASQPAAAQSEAEQHAQKAVADYLNACRLTHRDQIGNHLMTLASVVGVLMASAEGADAAFDRLLGTVQFVLKTMPKKPAKLNPVH